MKTRIFISCGQMKETGELEIARDVASRLSNDFDCYVALNEQTMLGLRENIFEQLSRSEYFLFIDFRRERLVSGTEVGEPSLSSMPLRCRGSLFTHQELAIASYLQLPVIAFHEAGIDERDGMRGVMQLNSTRFDSRSQLAESIEAAVRARWQAGWKRFISIEAAEKPFGDARDMSLNQALVRHFHLAVRNPHHAKVAEDCRVYLVGFEDLNRGAVASYEPIEVKWAGSTLHSVLILPGQARRFDAFQVSRENPYRLIFKGFSDSTEFRPQIVQPGKYRITYLATSSTLGTAKKTVEIQATGNFETVKMTVEA